jgi:TetR/AcrR family transcriptional regulator of autoinduction and epiphytic fitness
MAVARGDLSTDGSPPDLSIDILPIDRTTCKGPDGRSLRRDRNRAAVIQAVLELIREGDLDPPTAEIAQRAGVSHRSVFRYFDDLRDLVREAISVEFAAAAAASTIHEFGEGTLQQRIDAIITARLTAYDHAYGASRVARLKSGQIPDIDPALAEITRLLRVQLTEQFAVELSSRSDSERDSIVDAILLLTEFASYDVQRRMLGYDHDRIATVWRHAIGALLD